MQKFYPVLIVIVVISVWAVGVYFLLNQKVNDKNELDLLQNQTQNKLSTTTPPVTINPTSQAQVVNNSNDNFTTTESGLKIQNIELGMGRAVNAEDTVTVNYVGTLEDGTKFDSSYDRNQPFTFKVGAGEVIQGWDEGIIGMKEGGRRKLVIPPDLGYGSQAVGNIPPNSTLIFDIELLSVE